MLKFIISIEAIAETLAAEVLRHDAKHIIWAQEILNWGDIQLLSSMNPHYSISLAIKGLK